MWGWGFRTKSNFDLCSIIKPRFWPLNEPFFQALWTEPLSCGQQGLFPDPKLLLLPLPGCCVQPVSPSCHVQGLSITSNWRHASILPAGGKASSAPLHSPAFWPCDGSADAGEPSARPCHTGSRSGNERAGEASPAGEVHHQNHHVCFPVWVLEREAWKWKMLSAQRSKTGSD